LSFLSRLLGGRRDREAVQPLYQASVRVARDPAWYRQGAVPDTIDGRFDMLSAVLGLVMMRLEAEGESGAGPSVLLTETFIDDMDGTMRELGIGDVVVGKRMGKMLGALGGRLGAFRRAFAGEEELEAAVERNVFRGAPPSQEALEFVTGRLRHFHEALVDAPLQTLLAGELPTS
jgi:cytochrome b pre-mRNA-processing protein 3